jgi:HD-GYP domain-containing protein (c-di-GMP phosphodiesterase class II)
MEDEDKSKEELIAELASLRAELSRLKDDNPPTPPTWKSTDYLVARERHNQYVARLAATIAAEMDLPSDVVDGVSIAGLLMDIGMLFISHDIVCQPCKFEGVDYDRLKIHPKIAYDILKNTEFQRPVAQIIYEHHERVDGSGYPLGLKADEILLEARILAVADTVVAMCFDKPHQPAQNIMKIMEVLYSNKGKLYDDAVVDACVKLITGKGLPWR